MAMPMLLTVRVTVGMDTGVTGFLRDGFGVLCLVAVIVIGGMLMHVLVRVGVFVFLIVTMMSVIMFAIVVLVPVLVVGVRRALVDPEFHAFDILPVGALEVHVELAKVHFGEFPLEGGGLHAEVAKSAHGHVATDAGKTVEKENLHRGAPSFSGRSAG